LFRLDFIFCFNYAFKNLRYTQQLSPMQCQLIHV
jgi:hypothetical protein